MVPAILFDFDNTIANTESLREIRETGRYDDLDEESMAKVRLYKPVPELLATLRAKGIRLGVVTNSGSGYIRRVFDHLELNDKFDTVVTYSDVKAEGMKPSPKGLQLALHNLGLKASAEILYVGDENHDHVAAYHAGITPVMPSWATRKAVSMAPALEMSSRMLLDYVSDPDEYRLFAERCAELQTAVYDRKQVYFLPLDLSANVVTVKDEMSSFCLGRYYSQKAASTAWLHDHHALSQEIVKKEEQATFEIPPYWVQMLAHVVRKGPKFAFEDKHPFDVLTVIPGKKGKDPRLERLLAEMQVLMAADEHKPQFIPDVLYFVDDALSQKRLGRADRSFEARRALQINERQAAQLVGKTVLVIDDVVTTGSTLERAQELCMRAGAAKAMGLAIAKTVSIMEDERQCVMCGRPMKVKKAGASGDRFWGCSGYRDEENPCKHTEPLIKKECPRCERAMRIRTNGRTGEKFWGCTGFRETPQCNYSENMDPNEMPN